MNFEETITKRRNISIKTFVVTDGDDDNFECPSLGPSIFLV
jgi:hypothetical protein